MNAKLSTDNPLALDVANLTVSYHTRRGNHQALAGVNLQVAPGEIVAVVGETGSGKSTTAHAVLGLLPGNARVEAGSIKVHGTDITGWSPRRLRAVRGAQVGLVPQDPANSLDPLKTVGWQLAETLRLHGRGSKEDRAGIITELLEQVGLGDVPGGAARVASAYPHELSGGMRQRVLIASAIALRPSLVIADEPTSALDVTVQKQVLDVLVGLRDTHGMGLVLVTHDLGLAAERADQIVVLKGGVVQDYGPTAEVISQPKSSYTATLFHHSPALNPPPFRSEIAASVADGPIVINARGLTKTFPARGGGQGVVALGNHDDAAAGAGVNLQVRAGTTHGLVGESGSGKSTLARILLGLQQADTGTLNVAGIDLDTQAGGSSHSQRAQTQRARLRELRARVQLVYQNPFSSLNPAFTVEKIVADPLRNFRIGAPSQRLAIARQTLEQVAIDPALFGRHPRELSGGQRQRVAIARALVLDPQIVVLDEAVSALDVSVQWQILQLLDQLQRERGLTYVFITHDLDVVRQACDYVTVLRLGEVVEEGPTRHILQNPQHPYTRTLVDSVPRPPSAA